MEKTNSQKTETLVEEIKKYRVFDEMAFEIILQTDDLKEANNTAYNYQCVLIDNLTNKVLKDYSCEY